MRTLIKEESFLSQLYKLANIDPNMTQEEIANDKEAQVRLKQAMGQLMTPRGFASKTNKDNCQDGHYTTKMVRTESKKLSKIVENVVNKELRKYLF